MQTWFQARVRWLRLKIRLELGLALTPAVGFGQCPKQKENVAASGHNFGPNPQRSVRSE